MTRGYDPRLAEELARDQAKAGLGGAPRRPRGWLGASSVFGLVIVIVLFVLLSDRADEGDEPLVSPSPSHGLATSLMLPSG